MNSANLSEIWLNLLVYKGPGWAKIGNQLAHLSAINHHSMKTLKTDIIIPYISSYEAYLIYGRVIVRKVSRYTKDGVPKCTKEVDYYTRRIWA